MSDQASTSLNARHLAERMLDISDGIDRARLLRRVAEQDYVLPPEQIDAMQVLVNPTGMSLAVETMAREERRGHEEHLAVRVAAFKQNFFGLSCQERQRQWTSLIDECQPYHYLTTYLTRLKPGLLVASPAEPEDQDYGTLLETCRHVFVAPFRTAAELRLSFCDEWRKLPSVWDDIVDDMTEQYPEFFENVAPWVDAFGEQRFQQVQHHRESYFKQFAYASIPDQKSPHEYDIDLQRQLRESQREGCPQPVKVARPEFMSLVLIAIPCLAMIGAIAICVGEAFYDQPIIP